MRGGGEEAFGMEESVELSGGNQTVGRGFMGGVMDTILNRKRKSVTSESLSASSEVCDCWMLLEPLEKSSTTRNVRIS